MTINDHIKYWLKSAEHDLETAESLFQSKKYDWCLFLGHLVLEKTIKAIFIKENNNEMPPKTHNLVRLAKVSNVILSEENKFFLDEVNDFNIEVRYPDYKNLFSKRCTQSFTENYFYKIKEFHSWLKSLIK